MTRGEADLAAAGLTLTESRASRFTHSAAYYKLRPQVVYVAGTERPATLAEMAGRKVVVLADSSHVDELRRLQREEIPELEWEEVAGADTMELLEMLDSGSAELAIIDSNEYEVQRSLYPRMKVALDLLPEQERDMVWYLSLIHI